jgi:hypothetical protein
MLWLILLAWLSTPSDQQKHRYAIDTGMSKRDEWVDEVTETTVLKIDARNSARC